MPSIQHEFSITGETPFKEAESLLQLAIISAEGIFGAATVRMSVAYELDSDARTITIGTGTVAGDAVAKAFTSLLIRELGEDGFVVQRIDDADDLPDWPQAEGASIG